ncbi:MAG: hypothetical protein KAR06_11240 [Deltaproteobacteria bacterium]|nr:hypothetical protein [Deltaproteobacteria bacterium]
MGIKKLSNILSGFTKIQKQLEAYTGQVAKDLIANRDKITVLESQRREMVDNRAKAEAVSANLSTLLGDN